ncbi:TonB-dependent receptor [Sphingobacterium kitahiroshimense]|uniref:Carboxypeptidase-like regulatory domain-containing protein n=1 Tax=Sphingobacterium kitahiroshimense TaxID=470446 RepID=A0ABV0BTE7_9SPHI
MSVRLLMVTVLVIIGCIACAQTKISGYVRDAENNPLGRVSVTLKGTYDGAMSDSTGFFSFSTTEEANNILVASCLNYQTLDTEVSITGSYLALDLVLKGYLNTIDVVTVTAGSFGGGSGKRALTVLNTMDVVTTAGGYGDISRSINTLPGTQQIANQEGLFVRGGNSNEAKQFIDGVLVTNPFFGSAPGIPSRSRIDPSLFKGFSFSTGGYSAQYGGALSSALVMETIDMPEKSEQSLFVSPIALNAGLQMRTNGGKVGYGANYSFTDLSLYNSLVRQTINYTTSPQIHSANANFRMKTKNGVIKYYTMFGSSKIGVIFPNLDSLGLQNAYFTSNRNWFNGLSWREQLNADWKLVVSTGYSINFDKSVSSLRDSAYIEQGQLNDRIWYDKANFVLDKREQFFQLKAVIERKWNQHYILRAGGEYWYSDDQLTRNLSPLHFKDNLSSAFFENEIYFNNRFTLSIGGRAEHSSLLNEINLAPRVAFAYRFAAQESFSGSYGVFYQKPEYQFFEYAQSLDFTKATHYILNYQKQVQGIFIRVEAYRKNYERLVKTWPAYDNSGGGFAEGIEFYVRDKYKTIKSIDYSLSYSYLNTKRNHLNFPQLLMPDFAASHTGNLIVKKYFSRLNSGFSAGYTFASGRPYYHLTRESDQPVFRISDQGKTKNYQTLDLSIYYLTNLFGGSAIVYGSATNLLRSEIISGYNYSIDGSIKRAITPTAKSSYFIGVLFNWGIDRRQNTIDNL